MRSYQRGISTLIILVIFLISGVAIASSYFIFQQQKIKEINSFEECASLYPVMKSYPRQCNTPDGKSFTEVVINEINESSNSGNVAVDLKSYTQDQYHFGFSYPNKFTIKEELQSFEQFVVTLNGEDEELSLVVNPKRWGARPFGLNSTKEVVLNGITWSFFPSTNYCDAGECGDTLAIYQTMHGDWRYQFSSKDLESSVSVATILNSFHFTD